MALRTGWTGLELLSSPDEPLHVGLDRAARIRARDTLGSGVTPLSINSYVHVGHPQHSDAEVVEAIRAEAVLARDVGATAVRVFPGADGTRVIARRLKAAAQALPPGIEIWIETHDTHSTGRAVAHILDKAADARVRAVWDIAHPVHQGEPWQETLVALQPHLAHVQIKDEFAAGTPPLPLGDGTVPVEAVLNGLSAEHYPGWVSLEWERKWFPEAAPLEEVLLAAGTWLRERVRPN
ncbi:sugar phosphate isomerase/epimerase family protein [Streptomyces sp. NPDC019224]|uniref:sugar phosphate isomerase/epimerase family protein n=1 Tax=Streptomyces sp. NPDC019224 TaxID=3154484 RepID=UPI003408E46B